MNEPASSAAAPLTVYVALVLGGIAAVVALSWLLGPRHREPLRDVPYESGVAPAGTARLRFGAHFFLVAVSFLLFDLEGAILFAWAVASRELGWPGFWAALVFVVTLAAGLVAVWKEGGLDWVSRPAAPTLPVASAPLAPPDPTSAGGADPAARPELSR